MSAYAAKRKIAEFSSRGEEFLQKYDDLKVRQTSNLDPLVYLLSKVTEDRKLCGFLQTVRPHVEEAGPREISEVKVLDLVEGEEVELPEKGKLSVRLGLSPVDWYLCELPCVSCEFPCVSCEFPWPVSSPELTSHCSQGQSSLKRR